jgi:xanthine dehydrogenase accessory factor
VTTGAGELEVRAEELRAARTPFVSATVVQAERPTSAKPGDTALVLADGTVVGFVGGECAATSVQVEALAALAREEPVLLRITPSPPEEGEGRPGTVTVHNPCLSGGTLEIFLEPALPPPLVVVHGDAPIARALAEVARSAGYAVERWSGTSLPADATAVVVASHGRDEAGALAAALSAGVPYVGLVASPRRGAGVLDALGLSDDDAARVHTPAGLDIGSHTPGEVAVSILAEIMSVRPRRARTAAPAPADATGAAAVDPVCGMTVACAPASLSAELDGGRWWFCGTGCRDAFVADPGAFTHR